MRIKSLSMVIPVKAAPVTGTTMRTIGLSAVRAIVMQLREMINLGTDPMAVVGIKNSLSKSIL